MVELRPAAAQPVCSMLRSKRPAVCDLRSFQNEGGPKSQPTVRKAMAEMEKRGSMRCKVLGWLTSGRLTPTKSEFLRKMSACRRVRLPELR